MSVLVTGAAGFIGFHVALRLLERGDQVIGIDNLNDYYDPALKVARLDILRKHKNFIFHRLDLAEGAALKELMAPYAAGLDRIIHLAAQAGVRYSLINPAAYTRSNIDGHLSVLELARALPALQHLVYASSSSVYGANTKLPYAIEDKVDHPVSLYAATKKANELMSHCYSHLFKIPSTGLRFFTVYGPWGRPDMSPFLFAKAILANEPIRVFNHGQMRRDFTYIDDIVAGVIAVSDRPPTPETADQPPYKLYNIGNHQSEQLLRFIDVIETAVGRKAEKIFEPMQPGDVLETYADISAIAADHGYHPTTPIDIGIPKFVAWYRDFYQL